MRLFGIIVDKVERFCERYLLQLYLLLVTVHGLFVYSYGPRIGLDTDDYEELAARYILDDGLGVGALLASLDGQYTLYVLLVALLKVVLDGQWINGLLAVNWIGYAAAGWLLLRTVQSTGGGRSGLVVAFVLFLTSFEALQWAAYALTDAIYIVLTFFTVYLLWRAATAQGQSRWRWAAATVILLMALSIYRPTTITLWGVTLITVLALALFGVGSARSRRRYWLVLGSLAVVATLSLLYLIYLAREWGDLPATGAFDYVGALDYLGQYLAEGAVVHDRPITYVVPPPQNYGGFLEVFLLRFLYFFSPTVEGFSLLHMLLNLLFLPPLYLFSAIALWESLRQSSSLSQEQQWLVQICFTFVLVTALFHSVTLLDYDWRYRAPVILPLILVAALGASVLLRNVVRSGDDSSMTGLK